MKGKQYRGRPVPQRGRLLTPVHLDSSRSKGHKAVVTEAVAVVALVESKELWAVWPVLEWLLP